jgi:GTP cyclohydrolase I
MTTKIHDTTIPSSNGKGSLTNGSLGDVSLSDAEVAALTAHSGLAKPLGEASTQEIYAELLRRFDEDPTRDGLLKTPERVEKSMAFLTQGYHQSIEQVLHGALFDVDYDEMVVVKDIEFYSLCEHHMLPFFGKAHVAYLPQGKVVGLSKIPRIIDVFARRLQVQERMTQQIAEAIEDAIAPQGVGVVLEGQHLCMMMRGVEKQSSWTTTSAMRGVFKTQMQTRSEFLSLVRPHR